MIEIKSTIENRINSIENIIEFKRNRYVYAMIFNRRYTCDLNIFLGIFTFLELELVKLPEDTTLAGFTPLMSNPQDPCYVEKTEDMVSVQSRLKSFIDSPRNDIEKI